MRTKRITPATVFLVVLALGVAACVAKGTRTGGLHRWWAGLGPVIPHETFPADCTLCHVANKWDKLLDDFTYDHEKETGVALNGAHAGAQCLRCHNDRGPVHVFQSRGCVGCHEDVHQGDFGTTCTTCHNETSWFPVGQVALHNRTRFPLTGAHTGVSCHRCHPGGFVGNFQPVDTECATCHQRDLLRTNNPPHIPLGWINKCDRCHQATDWRQATVR